jgi:hypothetical protein
MHASDVHPINILSSQQSPIPLCSNAMASSLMSPQSANLSTLARSKLQLSFTKENCSLHRWVLLKNSITRANPLIATATTPDRSGVLPEEQDEEEDGEEDEEADSFMFPDAEKLGDSKEAYPNASEAAWLDSLLESLGHDEDEEFNLDSDVNASVPADEDEDSLSPLISPLISPMSSSDDLVNQAYYAPPTAVSYPVPTYHPPLIQSCELDSIYSSPHDSGSPPYDDPLPYHDLDDVEDLSVPDAIEDTSDDESDALTTPSGTHSSSMLSLVDPASIPLPAERRRRRPQLHIYVDPDDTYFYPFELDPLPFSDHYDSLFQEC